MIYTYSVNCAPIKVLRRCSIGLIDHGIMLFNYVVARMVAFMLTIFYALWVCFYSPGETVDFILATIGVFIIYISGCRPLIYDKTLYVASFPNDQIKCRHGILCSDIFGFICSTVLINVQYSVNRERLKSQYMICSCECSKRDEHDYSVKVDPALAIMSLLGKVDCVSGLIRSLIMIEQ